MNQVVQIAIGAILPPFIDLINRSVSNAHLRFIISLVVSLILGAVVAYFQNGLDTVLSDGTLIFTSAQTVYKMWYGDSGLQARIRG